MGQQDRLNHRRQAGGRRTRPRNRKGRRQAGGGRLKVDFTGARCFDTQLSRQHIMSKQYNKKQKRARRKKYVQRKKEQARTAARKH
jgi:hypothetical protein